MSGAESWASVCAAVHVCRVFPQLAFDDSCPITGTQAGIPGQRTASLGRMQLRSPNDAPYVVIEARAAPGARLGQFPFQWRTVTLPLGTVVPERRPRV